MRTLSTLAIAVTALGAVGCNREPGTEGPGSTAARPAPAVDAAPPLDARPPVPTGVPAFPARGARGPDPVAEEMPRYLMDYGYREDKGWLIGYDHAEVIAHALAIVRDAPGAPRARWWLARVVADDRFALEQLAPLVDAEDCDHCADVIRNLRWQGWPPAVMALAERVAPSPQRAAAEAIIDSRDPAVRGRYFRRDRVAIAGTGTNCDEDCVETIHYTGREVLARLSDWGEPTGDARSLSIGDEVFCRRDCCELPGALLMNHSTDYLRGFCFAPGTDQVVKVLIDVG